jgi:putative photosynthetic complex assembly protein
MSDPFGDRALPRGPLIGAGVLIAAAIVAAATVRLTGVGAVQAPPSPALTERSLRFEDAPAGAVVVFDATSGAPVDSLESGADGFIRATLRSLVRERRAHGIGSEVPFRLSRHADGRLILLDPATGRQIDLEAFGPTNSAAFARLLAPAPRLSQQ